MLVRHIKRDGAHLVAIPLDQIRELLRIARRCNELVSCSEYCFGKRASKATRTTCNQPYLWHQNFLLQNYWLTEALQTRDAFAHCDFLLYPAHNTPAPASYD